MRPSLVVGSFCVLFSTSALADSMRCGTHLITTGDDEYELLQKCGEPVYRQTLREPITRRHDSRAVLRDDGGREIQIDRRSLEPEYREIARWTFVIDAGSFRRLVDIENGKVIRITLGDRP